MRRTGSVPANLSKLVVYCEAFTGETEVTRILILGCGYTGERIAALHQARGDAVTVTSRDPDRQRHLRAVGFSVRSTDGPLPLVDRVYYTIPPQRDGEEDSRLRDMLHRLPPPRALSYFSTTGVYGDVGGEWVDEDSPLQPANDRSARRVDAEWQLRGWCAMHGTALTILRVAGIYGPGRLPLDRLADGKPVLDPQSSGYSNRIHVDDLAPAAVLSADAHAGGMAEIFNVADGHPTSTAEYLDALAALTGQPRPPRIGWAEAEREFSPMALSFLRDSKRVRIDKLLAVPGFQLRYADFRDGLRASLDS